MLRKTAHERSVANAVAMKTQCWSPKKNQFKYIGFLNFTCGIPFHVFKFSSEYSIFYNGSFFYAGIFSAN